MLRFQDGEGGAFDELVRRNTNKVHALVYRFLGDRDQLDDITQEVFLRIYRTAPRYRPAAKFSTWLYRIVANLCFNVLRSRKRSPVLPLDFGDAEEDHVRRDVTDESSPVPGEGLDRSELAEQIAARIAELPDNQRVALVLNRYENRSYEEIAEVLGCSTMAVKSLLSRARANLRDSLRRYLGPEYGP